jgi:hypothetical protein
MGGADAADADPVVRELAVARRYLEAVAPDLFPPDDAPPERAQGPP